MIISLFLLCVEVLLDLLVNDVALEVFLDGLES